MSHKSDNQCRFFNTSNGCKHGNSCHFRHSGGPTRQQYGGYDNNYNNNNYYNYNNNNNNNFNPNWVNLRSSQPPHQSHFDYAYHTPTESNYFYSPYYSAQLPVFDEYGYSYEEDVEEVPSTDEVIYLNTFNEKPEEDDDNYDEEVADWEQEIHEQYEKFKEKKIEEKPEEKVIEEPTLKPLITFPFAEGNQVFTPENLFTVAETAKLKKEHKFKYSTEDIMIAIFFWLSPQDLVSASRTCRDWYRISSRNVIWKQTLLFLSNQNNAPSDTAAAVYPDPNNPKKISYDQYNDDILASYESSIRDKYFSLSLRNCLWNSFDQLQFELEKDPTLVEISGGMITRQFVCETTIHQDTGMLLVGGNMGVVEAYDLKRVAQWARSNKEKKIAKDQQHNPSFLAWRTEKSPSTGAVVSLKTLKAHDGIVWAVTSNDGCLHSYKIPNEKCKDRLKSLNSVPIVRHQGSSSGGGLLRNQLLNFEADFNETVIAVSYPEGIGKNVLLARFDKPSEMISDIKTEIGFDRMILKDKYLFLSRSTGTRIIDIETQAVVMDLQYTSTAHHPIFVDELSNEIIIGGKEHDILVADLRSGKWVMQFPQWPLEDLQNKQDYNLLQGFVAPNGNARSILADWSTIITGSDCAQVWDRRNWKWRRSYAMSHRVENVDPNINGLGLLGERGQSLLVATEARSSVSVWSFY